MRTLMLCWLIFATTVSAQNAGENTVESADTLLLNGKILTVDAGFSVVQALAIRCERIVATGTSAALQEMAGPSTRVIDLKGATVVPGLMHTPLVEHRLVRQLGGNDAAALIAKRDAQVPLGKMGEGWDIAHAVLFLVSNEAKHITGTELIVDGGVTATL